MSGRDQYPFPLSELQTGVFHQPAQDPLIGAICFSGADPFICDRYRKFAVAGLKKNNTEPCGTLPPYLAQTVC